METGIGKFKKDQVCSLKRQLFDALKLGYPTLDSHLCSENDIIHRRRRSHKPVKRLLSFFKIRRYPVFTVSVKVRCGNDTLHPGSSNLIYGRQMAFSTPYWGNHVRILDASGSDMQAMVSTDPDTATSSQLFALNIDEGLPLRDGGSYVVEFEMQDAAGQLVIVTHSARWQASA